MFTPAPASPKQIRFITNLVRERELTDEQRHDMRMRVNRELTSGQARGIIESLLLLPKKASGRPAAASEPAAEGMHKLGDKIYKVQKSRSGSRYAKELVVTRECPGHLDFSDPSAFDAPMKYHSDTHCPEPKVSVEFVYARGMVYKLSEDTRMTLAEAKEWGVLYNTCCVCGATLTDATSVENGIGPICAKRFA